MEIAKVLPESAPEAPRSTGAPPLAEGGQGAPTGPPEAPDLPLVWEGSTAPGAVARFCVECLKYGDMTALDYRAPDGTLCAFHEADHKRKRDLEALGAEAAFDHEVARIQGNVAVSLSRADAWMLLAALLAALRGGK